MADELGLVEYLMNSTSVWIEEEDMFHLNATMVHFYTTQLFKKEEIIKVEEEPQNFFHKQLKEDHLSYMHERKDKYLSQLSVDTDCNNSLFKCGQCNMTLFQENLSEHMKAHSYEKVYKCNHCGNEFNRNCDFIAHVKQNHSSDEPFQCKVCNKAFHAHHELRAHTKLHSDTGYICGVCNKHLGGSKDLKQHLEMHISLKIRYDETPFKCKWCDKEFSQSSNLTAHIRVHTGEKPFECNECGKSFAQQGNLKIHLQSHASANQQLSQSAQHEKDITAGGNLKNTLEIEIAEKSYECRECGKLFKRNGDLKTHMRTHTGLTHMRTHTLHM